MLEIDRKREITGLERVASYHRNSYNFVFIVAFQVSNYKNIY